ncbi:phage head closure protein [Agrobacterium tumefaciens]|uniref:phage head closure protein n=1 Tax=Agrobacterium tumefaciens TaxID=358 RepID=UPI001574A722|nr:phage head closure protein [Agrobacterium tumefaciens]NTB96916.1 phage head closure protein [Agrobacterium tumefaciens]NTC44170.1 phage head closure protein [Agrobacterium tumefaciens]
MAATRSAGDLFHSVAFDVREEVDRGDGVTVGNWVEKFQVRAGFTPLRGGESVLAGRLQGQQTQIIFVRASSKTRDVNTDWRVRDVRSGVSYNIREITQTRDRLWLDFLCQSGVADG